MRCQMQNLRTIHHLQYNDSSAVPLKSSVSSSIFLKLPPIALWADLFSPAATVPHQTVGTISLSVPYRLNPIERNAHPMSACTFPSGRRPYIERALTLLLDRHASSCPLRLSNCGRLRRARAGDGLGLGLERHGFPVLVSKAS